VIFMPCMAFGLSVCKGTGCISRIDCFTCFVGFLFSLYTVICLNSFNEFRCCYLQFPVPPWPHFHPRLHFTASAPPPRPSPHRTYLNCYLIRIKKSGVLNTGLVRVDACTALWTER
jgi:hypothetical protein